VRESVFAALISWLGEGDAAGDQALAGVSFLDLYAGSGAVGLEASSRGAAPVRLVEREAKVAAVASQNAATLGGTVAVTRATVSAFLHGAPTPYDVVWLDPPYDLADTELDAVLQKVVEGGWLAPDGVMLVERSRRTAPPQFPAVLADVWSRRYGETEVWFATRGDDA